MYTTEEIYQQGVGGPYRALVTSANSTTGEIKVVIPSVLNTTSELSISYIGRKGYNGIWSVPEVGSQIVVVSDDLNLSNIFWLQVSPDPSVILLTAQVAALTAQVAALTA